jgi:hypothetical protein
VERPRHRDHQVHPQSGPDLLSADDPPDPREHAGETSDEFTAAQLALIDEYRRIAGREQPGRPGRVALGRVVVPFDGATAVTRARYRDYADSRHERTLRPQGPRRTLFAADVVGTAEQILDQLSADPVVARVTELRLELPYEFGRPDYEQILHDVRHLIAPELGWRAATAADSRKEEPADAGLAGGRATGARP